jgi:hypothetical protein
MSDPEQTVPETVDEAVEVFNELYDSDSAAPPRQEGDGVGDR